MNFRSNPFYTIIIVATLLFAFLPLSFAAQIYLFVLAVVMLGIPHGATDHLISMRTNRHRPGIVFYVGYGLAAAAYAVFWYLAPWFALLVFVLISAYHFGQSNLYYLFLSKGGGLFFYSLWGLYVLSAAIFWNWEESKPIIAGLTNADSFAYGDALVHIIPFALGITSLLSFIILNQYKRLSRKNTLKEVLNLAVLGVLFYHTSLLTGFAVYFALWHSSASIFEQLRFFKFKKGWKGLAQFYMKASPLSLITFIFMGSAYWAVSYWQTAIPWLSVFFFIIATVTVPHTLFVDQMYSVYARRQRSLQ